MKTPRIRVFVASPSDVAQERDVLAAVVNELNGTVNALTPDRSATIELLRWETHAYPGAGRPQGVITREIGHFDVFVGIMWRRFGTPSGRAESGTEEEFRDAFSRWSDHAAPHIMFYFSTAPIPPPKSLSEVEQLGKVVAFRSEISKKALIWEYEGAAKFAEVVRPHLVNVIAQLLPSRKRRASPASRKRAPKRKPRTPKRSPASAAAIPRPSRVRLTTIAPEDAFHSIRNRLVGRVGRLHAAKPLGDGWYSGIVELDTPLSDDLAVLPLFRFKWRRA